MDSASLQPGLRRDTELDHAEPRWEIQDDDSDASMGGQGSDYEDYHDAEDELVGDISYSCPRYVAAHIYTTRRRKRSWR